MPNYTSSNCTERLKRMSQCTSKIQGLFFGAMERLKKAYLKNRRENGSNKGREFIAENLRQVDEEHEVSIAHVGLHVG